MEAPKTASKLSADDARPGERLERGDRNEVVGHAAGMPGWPMPVEADLRRVEPQAPGGLGRVQSLAPDLGQARQAESRATLAVLKDLDGAGHDADALLQPEGASAGFAVSVPKREQNGRAHRRVAGEGQFPRRREDAQAGPVAPIRWRLHEHRLRQVELAGDRLHAAVVEALGVEHHGKGVAGQRLGREHVEDDVSARHAESWRDGAGGPAAVSPLPAMRGEGSAVPVRWGGSPAGQASHLLDREAPGRGYELVLRGDHQDFPGARLLRALEETVGGGGGLAERRRGGARAGVMDEEQRRHGVAGAVDAQVRGAGSARARTARPRSPGGRWRRPACPPSGAR